MYTFASLKLFIFGAKDAQGIPNLTRRQFYYGKKAIVLLFRLKGLYNVSKGQAMSLDMKIMVQRARNSSSKIPRNKI